MVTDAPATNADAPLHSTCSRSLPGRSATWTASTASSCPRRCSTRAADSGWPTTCSRPTCASSSRRTWCARGHGRLAGRRADDDGARFFRRSIELAAYAEPGQRIVNTIQTNGTLIDDEWAAFFARARFPGRRLDRRPARHARRLPRRQGRQAHLRPGDARPALLQRHDVEWNALTTSTPPMATTAAEVYRFLRDECGARFIQFIPIVERVTEPRAARLGRAAADRPLYTQEGNLLTDRSVGREQYGRFLIDVFEEWVRRDVGEVFVQMFDVALATGWASRGPVRALRDVRRRARARAQRRPLLLRPLRRAGTCSATSATRHMIELVASAQQQAVRPGQAGHAAAVLPGLRRPVRLSRRVPEGPVHDHTGRRTGAQLPVRRLQGVLPHVDGPMRTMSELLRGGRLRS